MDRNNQSQQGSGSAENVGKDRNEQVAQNINVNNEQRDDIARDAGVGKKDLADLNDLGANSGRDDFSGGSGDDMTGQSTGGETDKF